MGRNIKTVSVTRQVLRHKARHGALLLLIKRERERQRQRSGETECQRHRERHRKIYTEKKKALTVNSSYPQVCRLASNAIPQ